MPEGITEESLYYGRDNAAVDVSWDEELLKSFASALPWRGIYESAEETFSFGVVSFANLPSPTDTTTPLVGTGLDGHGAYTLTGSISGNTIIFVTTRMEVHEGVLAKRFEGVLSADRTLISGLFGEAGQFPDDHNNVHITEESAVGSFALAQRPAWWFTCRDSVDEMGIRQTSSPKKT